MCYNQKSHILAPFEGGSGSTWEGPENRKCPRCGKTLPLTAVFFYRLKKNQDKHFQKVCKSCAKLAQKEWPRRMAEKARQMRESLPKEEKATNSADRPFKWFKENEEALRKFFEPLDAVRKGKQNALAKKRKELNPWVKVANGVRARTSNAVRIFSMRGAIRKPYKRGEFRKITGCSEEDFRKHIMSFWPKDGSWGLHNFGKKEGWQVDHIVPISYFKDVWGSGDWELIFQYDKIVNHYTNLHPKSTAENIRKGDSRPEWVELEFGKLWSSFHEEIYGAGSKRRVLGIA